MPVNAIQHSSSLRCRRSSFRTSWTTLETHRGICLFHHLRSFSTRYSTIRTKRIGRSRSTSTRASVSSTYLTGATTRVPPRQALCLWSPSKTSKLTSVRSASTLPSTSMSTSRGCTATSPSSIAPQALYDYFVFTKALGSISRQLNALEDEYVYIPEPQGS